MSVRTYARISLLLLVAAVPCEGGSGAVYGPSRYQVTERYGKLNEHSFSISATDAVYLIKIQNGDARSARPDYLSLTVNGREAVRDGAYPYPFIACFVQLTRENSLHLSLRDERPSGFRRPLPVEKSVTITVLPVPEGMAAVQGSFGLAKWEELKDFAGMFTRFTSPAAARHAMDAYSLQLNRDERVAAVQGLADIKDARAAAFFVGLFTSAVAPSEVRAEAALAIAALDNPEHIPVLMRGLVDPEKKIRIASARGLSFYPEEQTGELLMDTLGRLDKFRRQPAIDSILSSGWKPVATMEKMAAHDDPAVSATALELIGKVRDPRSTELLLTMLRKGDPRNVNAVIEALGHTADPRATAALLDIAADPEQRVGKEVSLAEALVNLGDQRAERPIGDMIKHAQLLTIQSRLRNAYWRLTGEQYR